MGRVKKKLNGQKQSTGDRDKERQRKAKKKRKKKRREEVNGRSNGGKEKEGKKVKSVAGVSSFHAEKKSNSNPHLR